MKCPVCGHLEDRVIDSRPSDEGAAIRRRRECLACHYRFTTYEKVEYLPLFVVKKDGSREPFNREKLVTSIMKACTKRQVSTEQIEHLVSSIEAGFSNQLNREVTSEKIGEMVLLKLRDIDEVAYVRFASVYRRFSDVNSFLTELLTLLNGKQEHGVEANAELAKYLAAYFQDKRQPPSAVPASDQPAAASLPLKGDTK